MLPQDIFACYTEKLHYKNTEKFGRFQQPYPGCCSKDTSNLGFHRRGNKHLVLSQKNPKMSVSRPIHKNLTRQMHEYPSHSGLPTPGKQLQKKGKKPILGLHFIDANYILTLPKSVWVGE